MLTIQETRRNAAAKAAVTRANNKAAKMFAVQLENTAQLEEMDEAQQRIDNGGARGCRDFVETIKTKLVYLSYCCFRYGRNVVSIRNTVPTVSIRNTKLPT